MSKGTCASENSAPTKRRISPEPPPRMAIAGRANATESSVAVRASRAANTGSFWATAVPIWGEKTPKIPTVIIASEKAIWTAIRNKPASATESSAPTIVKAYQSPKFLIIATAHKGSAVINSPRIGADRPFLLLVVFSRLLEIPKAIASAPKPAVARRISTTRSVKPKRIRASTGIGISSPSTTCENT